MKKYLFFILILPFIFGCNCPVKNQAVVVKINQYEMTKAEFEKEFKDSVYGTEDTFESRMDFLDSLIFRQLILQDAQKKGLDRDKEFLKMIQRFWEQSLLKLALDKKSKEIISSVSVKDADIKEAYDAMLKEKKTDKSYEQMYPQIKWEISNMKDSQELDGWMKGMRKNSRIEINKQLLSSKN